MRFLARALLLGNALLVHGAGAAAAQDAAAPADLDRLCVSSAPDPKPDACRQHVFGRIAAIWEQFAARVDGRWSTGDPAACAPGITISSIGPVLRLEGDGGELLRIVITAEVQAAGFEDYAPAETEFIGPSALRLSRAESAFELGETTWRALGPDGVVTRGFVTNGRLLRILVEGRLLEARRCAT